VCQAGSDPDELHPTEGFAPLHAAVSSEASRTEVIRLLLAAGADVNLLRSANPIWSPLMYAATRGSLEHLQLLLGERSGGVVDTYMRGPRALSAVRWVNTAVGLLDLA
jgi:ankyrin repeat protein